MTEYTPGPWSYGRDGGVYAGDPREGTREDVAQVLFRIDANARLIASAPDMLEALQDSTWVLELVMAGDASANEVCEQMQHNQALIAKARGEAE